MPESSLQTLLKQIKGGRISSWDQVHDFYQKNASIYDDQVLQHALASWLEFKGITLARFEKTHLLEILQQTLDTREWMTKAVYESRAKDYRNPFRKMVYESTREMNEVVGKLEENPFILQQKQEFIQFKKKTNQIIRRFKG